VASAPYAILPFSFIFLVLSSSKVVLGLGTDFHKLVISSEAYRIFIPFLPLLHELSCFVELHDFSIEYLQNTYELLGLGKNYNCMT